MKPYEFKRIYHPKLGKFVYQHKGSGIIVDNIFKPMKNVVKKLAKPLGKKALESGVSHAGDRLGKKISEKSGDLIMKRLANMRKEQKANVQSPPKQEESTDMILNRLISGSGDLIMKRRRRVH